MGAPLNLATTYTEADPNSRIGLVTVTATYTGIKRDENAYLYKDWGAGFFGDFVHDFETTGTTWANGSKLVVWGISDTVAAMSGWTAGLYLLLNATSTTAGTYTLGEVGGAAGTTVGASIAKTIMFWRIERNGTTLTAKRATSAANRSAGTWAETLTLTVANTTYQYQFAGSSFNDANTTAVTQTTANFRGTGMGSAGTPFDSAYMTGASAGNWNAGATWGNAGTTKGTDWPGLAADVVNIDPGDTVTYNVSEANQLGADMTVYGTLTFLKSMDTLLSMAQAAISVGAAGALRIGTAANPIEAAHTAKLEWGTTGDNTKGLLTVAGGVIEIEGTDLNGGVMMVVLASNWTAGQTLTVIGDVHTSAWANGQKFVIHTFPSAFASAFNVYEYTIASMAANGGNTNITISEAAPGLTFRAGAVICNTTRNVTIGKYGATLTPGSNNTNRPYFRNLTLTNTTAPTSIKHATLNGMYSVGSYGVSGRYDMENVVVRNGAYLGCEAGWTCNSTWNKVVSLSETISRLVASRLTNIVNYCLTGFINIYDSSFTDIYTINVYSATGVLMNGSVSRNGFRNCDYVDVRAGLGNAVGTWLGDTNKLYNCNFGKFRHHANVCTMGSLFYVVPDRTGFQFYNCVFPWDPPTFTTWSASGTSTITDGIEITFDDFNGTLGDTRRFTKFFFTKKNGTTVRGGGAAASIEVFNLDSMDQRALMQPIFEWVEWGVTAGAQTRQIYIRGGTGGAEDWTTYPTAAELFLEAEYYDEAGTCHKAIAVSNDVLADNTTWTAFDLAFTTGRTGQVVYRLRFGLVTGLSGKKIYVDPQLNS